MAIQPNKPQNRVFLLVGIVLAVAAAAAVLYTISKSSSSSSRPTSAIVVAKSTIAAGAAITADLVTTAALPQGSFPADSFTDPSQVVGKLSPVTLSANIPLTASLFSSATAGAPGAGVVTHLDITKGYVAIAIPANGGSGSGLSGELVSAGYYIQAEDHIDIIVDGGGAPPQRAVRYAFQDVRVLRVGAATAAAAGAAGPAAAPGAVSSYIVELPRNQAELLAGLTSAAATSATAPTTTVLRYVLRPQAEAGKRDGNNGFDKPNYVSNIGTPVPAPADAAVTSAMLNNLSGH